MHVTHVSILIQYPVNFKIFTVGYLLKILLYTPLAGGESVHSYKIRFQWLNVV